MGLGVALAACAGPTVTQVQQQPSAPAQAPTTDIPDPGLRKPDATEFRRPALLRKVNVVDVTRGAVREGAVAHIPRDRQVDSELINIMLERNVPVIPTLALAESNYIFVDRPPGWTIPSSASSCRRAARTSSRRRHSSPRTGL